MNKKSIIINWKKVKTVIFDLDGTLYNQRKLRKYMFIEILRYYIMNLNQFQDIRILKVFRQEREKHAFYSVPDKNINIAQFHWVAKILDVSIEKVQKIVQKWIYEIPLKYIKYCVYQDIYKFIKNLTNQNISIAIYSDYPAKKKLDALGVFPNCIVCSTDKNVDCFKPNPKGLFVLSKLLKVSVKQCLFIGDRNDHDRECARRAGMPFLLVGEKKYSFTFKELNRQFLANIRDC